MGEDWWNPKREDDAPAAGAEWRPGDRVSEEPTRPDAQLGPDAQPTPPMQPAPESFPPEPRMTGFPGPTPSSATGTAEQYPAPPWVDSPRNDPPRPGRSKRVLAIAGGIATLLAVIGVKFGIGLLAGSVASTVASSFFGGPLNRLPPDQRQQYERRLDAAIGNQLDGLSKAAAEEKLEAWISGGLLRMDDSRLVHRMELEMSATFAVDERVCATFAREAFGSGGVTLDTSTRLLDALDTGKLGEWIGMNVDAIESEAAGAPAQRRVSDAAIDQAFDRLARSLAAPTTDTMLKIEGGGGAADAEACAAVRNFFGAAVNLDESARGVIARYAVQDLD